MPYDPSVPCGACSRLVDPLRARRVLAVDDGMHYFCDASCQDAFRAAARAGRARRPTPASPLRAVDVPQIIDIEPQAELRLRARLPTPWVLFSAACAAALGMVKGDATGLLSSLALTGLSGILLVRRDTHRDELGPIGWLLGPVGCMALSLSALFTAQRTGTLWAAACAVGLVWMRSFLATTARLPIDGLLKRLRARVPERTRMSLSAPDDDSGYETRESSTASIRAGEDVLVEAGDVVPVDGVVAWGEGRVLPYPNASDAVERGPGAAVLAGAQVVEGTLRVTATRVGDARALFRPSSFAREGAGSAGMTRAAAPARSAAVGTLFLVAVAVLCFVFAHTPAQMLSSFGASLLAMPLLSLLLGATWPFVSASAIGVSKGIVFRDAATLERAGRVTAAALCTDGTVTEGYGQLLEVSPLGRDQDVGELTALAMGAELAAEPHPLAQAVLRFGAERGVTPTSVRRAAYARGRGVTALVDGGAALVLGNRHSLLQAGVSVAVADREAQRAESQGRTVVFLSLGGRARALFIFEDPVRPEARAAVQRLIDLDVEVVLLSGDHRTTVEALARTVDVTHVKAELSSEERAAEVGRLREAGGVVAVIGHAPADDTSLGAADIAVTLDAAGGPMEGDVAVASDDLRHAAEALTIARAARRTSQAVVAATLVSGVGLSLTAAIGVLHPLVVILGAVAIDAWALPSAARLLRRTRRARAR
jgi:P-type E1-E2 ATPase